MNRDQTKKAGGKRNSSKFGVFVDVCKRIMVVFYPKGKVAL